MRTRLVLVGLLCALPALGLEPYLVKDINPVPKAAGSSPSNFVSLGSSEGVAVFTAFDGESSLEWWRTDGTAAGTWKLADVCADWTTCGWVRVHAAAGGRTFLQAGADLWVTDGTTPGTLRLTDGLEAIGQESAWVPEQRVLYFVADDGAHGSELWRTDGTPAGTHLAADLVRGPEGTPIQSLTAFRGRIWFAAVVPNAGGGVWSSDGTERGTVAVESGLQTLPHIHGVVGRRLLFEELTGRQAAGLWATDGTERGTAKILRLRTGIWDSSVQDGRLFFVAVNPGHGQELWVSDGTARGTRVVSDIPGRETFFSFDAGRYLSLPRTPPPGRFLFRAWDPAHGVELWASDGTPEGTRMVRDVCPGPCPGVKDVLLSNQGLFYFVGFDSIHGLEPWASDGTPEGTRMVRDLCPGEYSSILYTPLRFAGRLLFAADDCVNGFELWTTDGTAAGTVRITDFAVYAPVDFSPGAVVGGRYLFAGNDGEHGSEPWSTDGTIAGSGLVEDVARSDVGGSMISGIRALGDQAVFFADDGIHGFELWKSDGTAAGTSFVAERSPGPEPYVAPQVLSSAEAGGELFLLLNDFNSRLSLWRTDGTAAGTVELLGPESRLWEVSDLHAVGGRVIFTASDGSPGPRLWSTDGTVAGTQAVEPEPGKALPYPAGLAELNGKLYVFATTADGLNGLWRTDGTAAGTVQVKSFSSLADRPISAVHADRLWFSVATPSGSTALWSSDGTAAGTRIEPLPGLPQANFMVSIGSKLMIAGRGQGPEELWSTDGTPEGTRKVGLAPWFDPALGILPRTVFQGRLVFATSGDPYSGQLWTSDGTPEGTGPLLDRDGKRIPPPVAMAVSGDGGDRLVFSTAVPAQVWESDGTPEGTGPLAPERPIGFNTGAVGRAGNRVFFGAWEPETGLELWAVEP